MTQVEFQRYQEQTFDSYVKRLIRNEGRNAKKELARRAERGRCFLPGGKLPIPSWRSWPDEKNPWSREGLGPEYHPQGGVPPSCVRGAALPLAFAPRGGSPVVITAYPPPPVNRAAARSPGFLLDFSA